MALDLPSSASSENARRSYPWLNALERRAPVKVVITAAANKLARIAWAVLSSGQDYRAVPDAMTA